MRTCVFCKGEVIAKRIDHMCRWGDRYILIRDLPAEVCSQCGEVYFPPDSVGEIDRRAAQAAHTSEFLSVPVV